ncbi:MAG TPA: 3-hydroxyacyl-ACP dehydratase FabZ [Bacilli bacterium]|nr:3-hydroxyacyl-ACP dehydratase FabZ [Bacilli bacterium]
MLSRKDIEAIIPHRQPFLLIDEIIELIPTKRAVGTKLVNADDFWVPGHFPGMPVMPGVLIIEALAQVGAVCLLTHDSFKGKLAYFAGIDNAKFRRKVIPGDVLRLEIDIIKLRSYYGIGKFKAFVGDEVAAEATCSFAITS